MNDASSVEVAIQRWKGGHAAPAVDRVAEEVPVALVYHGVPHVVMLASPADLEDYAVGFTLSEGLVAQPDEIQSIEVERGKDSIDVRIGIAAERFSQLLQRHLDQGTQDLAFLIGGPDGHSAETRKTAGQLISLSEMTWPHRLVRLMLLEQIYRAVTIMVNHPYHRP